MSTPNVYNPLTQKMMLSRDLKIDEMYWIERIEAMIQEDKQ